MACAEALQLVDFLSRLVLNEEVLLLVEVWLPGFSVHPNGEGIPMQEVFLRNLTEEAGEPVPRADQPGCNRLERIGLRLPVGKVVWQGRLRDVDLSVDRLNGTHYGWIDKTGKVSGAEVGLPVLATLGGHIGVSWRLSVIPRLDGRTPGGTPAVHLLQSVADIEGVLVVPDRKPLQIEHSVLLDLWRLNGGLCARSSGPLFWLRKVWVVSCFRHVGLS